MNSKLKARTIPHTWEQRDRLLRLMHDVEPEATICSLAEREGADMITAIVLKHTRKTNRLINFIRTNFYLADYGFEDLGDSSMMIVVALVVSCITTNTTEEDLDNIDDMHKSIETYNHTYRLITEHIPKEMVGDAILQAFVGMMTVNGLKSIDTLVSERERETK